MLCRINQLNHLIYEVSQGVHSFTQFSHWHFSMGDQLFLSKKEDCSEEDTGKQEETISRRSSADCVEHFCVILRSIWQSSLVRNAHNSNTSWNRKLLFVIFFQQTPCITGLSLWNGEELMEVWDFPHCKQEWLQYPDPGVLCLTQTTFSAFVSQAFY